MLRDADAGVSLPATATTDPGHTTVILGAGQAGGETATWLRQFGYAGRILLVGEEQHPPYRRPPLSKSVLAGTMSVDGLLLRPAASYAKAGIDLLTGTRAVVIDAAGRRVALADGRSLSYDRLVLALGGRVRRLDTLPGAQAPNLLYLRDIADAESIRSQLVAGRRMVVVGGGYVGLEVAASAVKAGLHVTVLEAAPRLLARVAEPDLSSYFRDLHRRHGVDVRTQTAVSGFETAAGRIVAVLAGTDRIAADVVVVGIGLIPNIELAATADLAVEDGILVDAHARTSVPEIFAVGDCANHVHPGLGRRIRIESVPSASELAQVAASVIAGSPRPVAAVPWFWSEQYDSKLQMVGIPDGYDEVVTRGDAASGRFSLFYRKDGRLQAVASINRPQEFPVVRDLVARRAMLDAAVISDPQSSLKTAAADAGVPASSP